MNQSLVVLWMIPAIWVYTRNLEPPLALVATGATIALLGFAFSIDGYPAAAWLALIFAVALQAHRMWSA